ncbi:MAG TPA: thiamine pyrophosphate-binding protein [Hyphomicrobiales bacterium]|nr:thiamine pyrophosphate-binding protein [Hyphomicrobiales bacterium]
MASDYTVADLVAEFIAACGVRTAFGVASVHNLAILDAIGRRNAVRFVAARGEMGAAHMADGYARVTGGLGVFVSSTGPGAANAVGGLVEARIAGTPVLHITSQTSSRYLDRKAGTVHDAFDQLGMLHSVSKAAYRVRSPDQAIGILMRAATDALTVPTGPVSVEIPNDVERAAIRRPAMLDHLAIRPAVPQGPTAADLDELAARVAAAKRPVSYLGSGGHGAGAEIRALLDMGFGMVSSWKGRGVVPDDHPMNLSGLQGNGIKAIQDFYGSVDLMLVVGARMRGHELGEFAVKLPPNLVQIDADPLANGRTQVAAYFVCADAKATLAALLPRLAGTMAVEPGFPGEFRALKRAAWAEFLGSLGIYGTFMEQLRAAMPKDAVFARDITQSTSTWANRIFTLHSPHDGVYPVSAGIGQGLPLAIGAAVAAPGRRTLLLTGDGGFMLNFGELWTALQERLDLTVVVMNDGGYGVIKKLQSTHHGGRRYFADLAMPDFAQIAAMSNMGYWRCAQADAFGATVAEALKRSGPNLVEVDMAAIGEFEDYFPFKRAPAG